MKVYITQYALTTGIIEKEVEISTISPKMVTEIKSGYQHPYHKPYWHTTKEEAIQHANLLKDRKIASHQKAIKKLQNLTFK